MILLQLILRRKAYVTMIPTNKKGRYAEIIIPDNWKTFTIDTLLREYWKGPKKLVHQWRMDRAILLNGKTASWSIPLTPGDSISLPFFENRKSTIIPTFHDLDVLYEDDHLMIVNKPSSIDTHPSSPEDSSTLLNFVAFHVSMQGEDREVKHIHRLDRDTTGAVLFAKHPFVGAILDRMLEERQIKRTYLALVHGDLKKNQLKIDAAIGRDRHHPTRRRVSPTGQKAVTHIEKIKYFPNKKLTFIKCNLETGRTHQIRVHLSHIGHPLAGDTLYGGKNIFPRQALHAYKMELTHPITEECITVYAPFIDQPPIFPELDENLFI